MSCNHTLIHYTSFCTPPKTHSGQNRKFCKNVEGPTRHIEDTCAKCHPTFVEAEINNRYDLLRTRLNSKLHRASSSQEAMELRREINEAQVEYGKEMRAVRKLKWSGDVIWAPGGFGGEVDMKECEFWDFLDQK